MKFAKIVLIVLSIVNIHEAGAQTTFHGNNARTGVFDSRGPTKPPTIKWKFKTNGHIFSSPAVTEGIVLIGSADTHLYAIDQETGVEVWKFKTGGPVSSSPAVAFETVYFGSSDGSLYAVALKTGALRWKFSYEGGERRFQAKGIHGARPKEQTIPDPWDLYLSSPAVSGDRVYVGSGDGNVYALDAKQGRLLWKFATKDVVHASPTVTNNTVYIGSWDSYLYALNAETGREKWRFKTGTDPENYNQVGLQASASVAAGTVYVGCRDGHLYAINETNGQKKWELDTKRSWVNGTPAVHDGLVYVGTSDTHLFHAVDSVTGQVRFTYDARSQIFSSAAIAGDLVYVGDFFGSLYAIDRMTGKLAWEFQTDAARTDPLDALTADGKRNPLTFKRQFNDFQDLYVNLSKVFSLGSILSSPVVDRGEIYFGSTDGFLYALR